MVRVSVWRTYDIAFVFCASQRVVFLSETLRFTLLQSTKLANMNHPARDRRPVPLRNIYAMKRNEPPALICWHHGEVWFSFTFTGLCKVVLGILCRIDFLKCWRFPRSAQLSMSNRFHWRQQWNPNSPTAGNNRDLPSNHSLVHRNHRNHSNRRGDSKVLD